MDTLSRPGVPLRASAAAFAVGVAAALTAIFASSVSAYMGSAATAITSATSTTTTTTAAADARFGLVGTGGAAFAAKFGFRYYTLEGNYSQDNGTVFSSVDAANDPAEGFSVVREVAKLNVRTDDLGQTNAQFQAKLSRYAQDLAVWYLKPSWLRGTKPAFGWYSPDAGALVRAESLQIVETIRREKARSPAVAGTVWEIGNEPNLFPAITPAEYAAIFAAYRTVIKAEDPEAVVAMGALFMPEPCEDLKAKLGEELAARMRTELETAGYYNTLNDLGLFTTLVNDVKNTLLSRMLALPGKEYLRQVLDATAARPDLVTLHAYPYDDRAPFLDSAALGNLFDTTLAGIRDMLAEKSATAPLWITEFGNIEQGLEEDAVAARSSLMIDAFMKGDAAARWFHYKSTGSDEQFALFSTGAPPLTRLAAEAGFAPADGGFSCAELNAVGLMLWSRSHGGEACADPIPDPHVTDTIPDPDDDTVPGVKVPVRPVILNPEGSALNGEGTLGWGWGGEADPSLEAASQVAWVEIYRDTAASAVFQRDSLSAESLSPDLPVSSGAVWARVRLGDGAGYSTPWSEWRMLQWQAPAVSVRPIRNPARLPLLLRGGDAYDLRGRKRGL